MAGVLVAVLAMPLAVSAQQTQPPPPAQAQGPQGQAPQQGRPTPDESVIQRRWMKRLGRVNLSSQQQQQIQSTIHQFSQAHPAGSPRDPQAARQLRQQILGVLNTDQQNQYHQQMQERRAQMQQRRQEQGGQQGPPDQGPPPNQGSPPDQQPPPNTPPA